MMSWLLRVKMDFMGLKIFSLLFIQLMFIGTSCSNSTQISENTNQNNVETSSPKKEKVFWGEHGELTSTEITQKRDMSQYSQKYFDCAEVRLKTAPKSNCDENEIQSIIWQNWLDKKKTYVVITRNSVDAFASNHIFIEPDESGKWCIVWRIARSAMNANGIDDVPKIISVERVENKPEKGKWALAFKDVNGSIVQKIPYFVDDPLIIRG